MKTQMNRLNAFLYGVISIVGFVSIAYLANLLVAEWFGGVNPLLEFSTGGFSKIESSDTKNRSGLGVAYQACKEDLGKTPGAFEFPDDSYEAWDLSEGRFLIETRIYTHAGPERSRAANLLCRVLKTEDNEYFAVHWTVQGIQVSVL